MPVSAHQAHVIRARMQRVMFTVAHRIGNDRDAPMHTPLAQLLQDVAGNAGATLRAHNDLAPAHKLLLDAALSMRHWVNDGRKLLVQGGLKFLLDPISSIGANAGEPLDALALSPLYTALKQHHWAAETLQVVLLVSATSLSAAGRSVPHGTVARLLADSMDADYLLVVFRDHAVHIHPEWTHLMAALTRQAQQGGAGGAQLASTLAGLRAAPLGLTDSGIKESEKLAVASGGALHRAVRCTLAQELQRLLSLLQAAPGILAPKFPLVLAALACARGEITWYLHHACKPPAKDSAFFGTTATSLYSTEQYVDDGIAVLVGASAALTHFVRSHGTVITSYFGAYLQHSLLPSIAQGVQGLVQHEHARSHPVGSLQDIVQVLGNCLLELEGETVSFDESAGQSPMARARLTLQRVHLFYSCVETHSALKRLTSDSVQLADQVLGQLNHCIDFASWFADSASLEETLVRFATLQSTWWFHDTVRSAVRNTLRRSATQDDLPPACVMHCVRCLSDAPLNSSGIAPAEHTEIGQAAVRLAAHEWTADVCSEARAACDILARHVAYAEAKADVDGSVFRKVFRLAQAPPKDAKDKAALASAVQKACGVFPGTESVPGWHIALTRNASSQAPPPDFEEGGLRALHMAQGLLATIVGGAAQTGTVLVFDTHVHPAEAVRHAVLGSLRDALRSFVRLGVAVSSSGPMLGGRRASIGAAVRARGKSLLSSRSPSASPVAEAMAVGPQGATVTGGGSLLGGYEGARSGASATGLFPPSALWRALQVHLQVSGAAAGFGAEMSELARSLLVQELVEAPGEHGLGVAGAASVPEEGAVAPRGGGDGGLGGAPAGSIGLCTAPTPAVGADGISNGMLGESFASHVAKQLRGFCQNVVGVAPVAQGGAGNAAKCVNTAPPVLFSPLQGGAYVMRPFDSQAQAVQQTASLPLSLSELPFMGALLGVRGWRVVSASLLGLAAACACELGGILADLKPQLRALEGAVAQTVSGGATPLAGGVATKADEYDSTLRGIDHSTIHRAASLVVTVGHCLTIRSVLAKAVCSAGQRFTPARGAGVQSVQHVVSAAHSLSSSGAATQPPAGAASGDLPPGSRALDGALSAMNVAAGAEGGGASGGAGGSPDATARHSSSVFAPGSTAIQQVSASTPVGGGSALSDALALGADVAAACSSDVWGLPDAALQNALREVGIGAGAGVSAARDLWSYLPALLALTVGIPDHNPFWKGAVFSPTHEMWSNNAHVSAPAVHGLLHSVFHLVFQDADTPAGRASNPSGHVAWLRRYLALSAFGVTHAINGSGSSKAPALQLPLLLQHIAQWGGYLPHSEERAFLNGPMLQAAAVRAAVGERGAPPRAKSAPFGVFGGVQMLYDASAVRRDAKAAAQ